MSIRSILKMEAYLAVKYKAKELKTEILTEVDRKMIALQTRLTHCMNEDCQTIAIRLWAINDVVATFRDGQQKMWGAIERINKDLQELIQRDVGTD